MIKAVIFDMDGLMFDTERLTVHIWDELGTELGYGKISGIKTESLGVRVGSQQSRDMFRNHFGAGFPYDRFIAEFRERIARSIETDGLPVKPGLYASPKNLKAENYRTAVASSTRRESVLHYCDMTNVTGFFSKIICGDMVEKGKPDPQIYLTAAHEIGVEPKDCMVLEDSPNGILSSYRAGMKTVMVPDLVEPDETLRPMLYACVPTLGDVIPLLKNLKLQESRDAP